MWRNWTFLLWCPAVVISKKRHRVMNTAYCKAAPECFFPLRFSDIVSFPLFQGFSMPMFWSGKNQRFLRSGSKSGDNRRGGFGMSNPDHLPIKLLRRRKKTLLKYFSLSIRHDGRMFVKWFYWWIPHWSDLIWKHEEKNRSVLTNKPGDLESSLEYSRTSSRSFSSSSSSAFWFSSC